MHPLRGPCFTDATNTRASGCPHPPALQQATSITFCARLRIPSRTKREEIPCFPRCGRSFARFPFRNIQRVPACTSTTSAAACLVNQGFSGCGMVVALMPPPSRQHTTTRGNTAIRKLGTSTARHPMPQPRPQDRSNNRVRRARHPEGKCQQGGCASHMRWPSARWLHQAAPLHVQHATRWESSSSSSVRGLPSV